MSQLHLRPTLISHDLPVYYIPKLSWFFSILNTHLLSAPLNFSMHSMHGPLIAQHHHRHSPWLATHVTFPHVIYLSGALHSSWTAWIMKFKASNSSIILVTIYHRKWHYISEDLTLHQHFCENLNSQMLWPWLFSIKTIIWEVFTSWHNLQEQMLNPVLHGQFVANWICINNDTIAM